MTDASDAARSRRAPAGPSNDDVAQSLGLIAPQHVVGWAQDGADATSMVAVVDISGHGWIETWVARGMTMSGLWCGVYGTLAFVTTRRMAGQSVLKIEVWHGDERLCDAEVIPRSDGLVIWAHDLDAHGEWPVDDSEQPTLLLRWLTETEG